MVIALLCHVGIMILDRYLYLTVTSEALISRWDGDLTEFRKTSVSIAIIAKAALHIVLTVFVHLLVFWLYPISGNLAVLGRPSCPEMDGTQHADSEHCNNFQLNTALQVFYLLYLVYLVISAFQLKLGLPIFRKCPFSLTQVNFVWSKWLLQIYLSIPFLCELRTLIDWSLTRTSLDLWQWLKFEDNYYRLYIAKINQSYYLEHVVGEPISRWWKFLIGICGTLGLIFVIMIPLVIFSDLNFAVYDNPIKAMSVEFGFLIDSRNYFSIFLASRIRDMHYVNETEWKQLQFAGVRDVDLSEMPDIQVLTIPLSGDSLWDITPEGRSALNHSMNLNTSTIEVFLTTTYTRPVSPTQYPPSQQTATHTYKKQLPNEQVRQQLDSYRGGQQDGEVLKVTCENLFHTLWRIPSAGDRLHPSMISRYADMFLTDVEFVLKVTKTKLEYWQVGVPRGNSLKELRFYILSEKYSPATLNFGIVTFYLTVVIFLARMLRLVTGSSAENFICTEMRRPDMLLDLSDAVYLARMTGDLKNEETLFYELIDIMRSPEAVLMVTGRCSIYHRGKEKTE